MYDRAEAAVLRMVPRDERSICWDTVLDCDMASALRIALEKAKACAPTDLKARIRCRGGAFGSSYASLSNVEQLRQEFLAWCNRLPGV